MSSSSAGPEPSPDALHIQQIMQERVGYFRNTRTPGTAGVCEVCRGPAEFDLCARCMQHRNAFGELLADQTVQLTYAIGDYPRVHQSARDVRQYKGFLGTPSAPRCMENLQLMMGYAVAMHGDCFATWLGASWDSLTFVPSRERPDARHPLRKIAQAIVKFSPHLPFQKFLLEPSTGSDVRHELTADRFVVPERWRPAVEGRHVLIIDDTWTTGASIQGASIATKHAGALSVTALCVDRWLKWSWPDHRRLIETLQEPYDPLRCPMDGTACRPAREFKQF